MYEGIPPFGHGVVPVPVTASAAILSEADFPPELPAARPIEQAKMLFREDSFDAVSRVRRGRFYTASATRPEDWRVFPHPHRPTELREVGVGGTLQRSLYSFQPLHLPQYLKVLRERGAQPLVAIGGQASFTIWSISSIEETATAEHLVTLRGRETFGALPSLKLEAIPQTCRDAILRAFALALDDIYRAGSGSVVDRCRDLASAALSGYLQHLGAVDPGKDLFELIKRLQGLEDAQKKRVVASAAEIVRLFHSRNKSAEQERRSVLPLLEQDAQLAVSCVGCILRELGWADWT